LITLPFVVREVLPVLESGGQEEEEAAQTLGAKGWQIFWRVTLPRIRWALLYGVILTTARALGEFGAVAVVSGKVINHTNTLTLHIERVYMEYQTVAAFAGASLLTLIALATVAGQALLGQAEPEQTG
ncbi:MAG: ABC transporter permease subunit, partial [Gloeomargarita sp. DG02_3_bins_56]